MVSIALVEDHAALRKSLALMLEMEPDFQVIEQAESLAEARECDLENVDVALIDIFLPMGTAHSSSRSCVSVVSLACSL